MGGVLRPRAAGEVCKFTADFEKVHPPTRSDAYACVVRVRAQGERRKQCTKNGDQEVEVEKRTLRLTRPKRRELRRARGLPA